MKTITWKYYKIRDLFDISVSKDKNLLSSDFGRTPYVSSSANNNGVSCCVDSVPSIEANTITVARNGSVGATFYQPNMYCASPDDVRILSPKFKITPAIGLFLCTIIEQEKYRYAYGRKFGTKRMSDTRIKLPSKDDAPDWEYIEEYVTKTLIPQLPSKARQVWEGVYDNKPISSTFISLDSVKWNWFRYDEIFDIKKGFYNKKPEESGKGTIPFIGATESNNGITSMHTLEEIEAASKTGDNPNQDISEKMFAGNCITVSNNGSIGFAFYQENEFTCSHDVNPLYLKGYALNKHIAMFLCTLIELEQYRWAYGRKWRPKRMPSSLIKLPIKADGTPDWKFMENYIKSLPYSANI